ncbi:hypothetical protein L7F22_045820 [Adiantum nelumboides]|nr:hypothetical protein [Adiantum nelumboides]
MAGLSSAGLSIPAVKPSSRHGCFSRSRARYSTIRAERNNSGDASPRSASMSTNDESPNFVLRAACSVSDTLQGPLGHDYIVQSIIDDYDKGYFVTGNVSSGVYEEDCEFADPAGSFKSLKRFKNNCSNFRSLLEKSDVKLVKSEELHDKFVAYWRFSCVLKFPWRPILSSTGFTEYYFNAETGRICRHVENWDVPKMALLGQVFKPNPALKRR